MRLKFMALAISLSVTVSVIVGTGQAIGAPMPAYRVVEGGIPVALTEHAGDVARGRDIATNRQVGLCQLCHQVPGSVDRFQGDIATSLAGAGGRWTAPQLRLRIVDSRRVNADSVMPAYFKIDALQRVGATWRDQPILNAQQIEDVVAWLVSLK